MRLESGPAKAERNWRLVQSAVFVAFALYFVYDGAIGYPNKNRKKAAQELANPTTFNNAVRWEDLGETPTLDEFQRLLQERPSSAEGVHAILGLPQHTAQKDGATAEYFVSRYGFGVVRYEKGTIKATAQDWHTWDKTRAQTVGQYYWALVPGLLSLVFLRKLVQAVTLRVIVDDEGLVYAGRRIGFDRMVALKDYNPKGWIDLYYKAGNREQKLRLDNEKVARFDEIVDLICQTKGFDNEVKEYAECKAREKAEEEAAAAAEDALDAPDVDSDAPPDSQDP